MFDSAIKDFVFSKFSHSYTLEFFKALQNEEPWNIRHHKAVACVYTSLAHKLYVAQKFELARSYYQLARKHDPENAAILECLARVSYQLILLMRDGEERNKLGILFADIAGVLPEESYIMQDYFHYKSVTLFENGAVYESLQYANKVNDKYRKIFPGFITHIAVAFNHFANTLFTQERVEESIYFYTRAHQLLPENIVIAKNLAIAYSVVGVKLFDSLNYYTAIEYFDKASQVYPLSIHKEKMGRAYYMIGCESKTKMSDKITYLVNALRNVRDVEHRDEVVNSLSGIATKLVKQDNYELAIRINTILAVYGFRGEALYSTAALNISRKNYYQAYQQLNKIEVPYPQYLQSYIYNAYARLYYEFYLIGRYDKAFKCLNMVHDKNIITAELRACMQLVFVYTKSVAISCELKISCLHIFIDFARQHEVPIEESFDYCVRNRYLKYNVQDLVMTKKALRYDIEFLAASTYTQLSLRGVVLDAIESFKDCILCDLAYMSL